jgi:hypothetical protein
MLPGIPPHTYTTHPKRSLVHFWNIKLLSITRPLHHRGIRADLSRFLYIPAFSWLFPFYRWACRIRCSLPVYPDIRPCCHLLVKNREQFQYD